MKKLYLAGILMLVAAVLNGCGEVPALPDAGVPNRVSQSDKPDSTPNAPARPTPTETTETQNESENEPAPQDSSTTTEENNGQKFYENERLGFRFPLSIPRGITGREFVVQEMEIPAEPTRFTSSQTIGYFQVRTDNGFSHVIITIEGFEEGLNPDDTPRVVPAEGGLSDEYTMMPYGIMGYHYLSNALGDYKDAHITVFRQDRIFYLRTGNEVNIRELLIDFARKFEITR